MANVLGISASHNGAVALTVDGKVHKAIQAERISRRKRQSLRINENSSLIRQCVSYCFDEANLSIEDIDAVAITTPWRVDTVNDELIFKILGVEPRNYVGTFHVPHHLSHMEYITHYGAKMPGIVLVVDGSGSLDEDRDLHNVDENYHKSLVNFTSFCSKEVISAYWFDGSKTELIYRFSPSRAPSDPVNNGSGHFLQSIGHYWEWASYYCFGSGNEAGKLMGLAAFGDINTKTEPDFLTLKGNGMLELNYHKLKQNYKRPNILFKDLSTDKHYQNLAMKVQRETESTLLKLLQFLYDRHPADTLYLSGGVALNVVANEKIKQSGIFKNVVLNGSVEDNGTAIGAALATNFQLSKQRQFSKLTDYYGKEYTRSEILEALGHYDFAYTELSEKATIAKAAGLINEDKIFGWFQGRSEFGPRALGNRSIFANPQSFSTKFVLDNLMKCRDRYRPYAPVVLEERAKEYFEMCDSSPVMMRNVRVLDKRLRAVTHVDSTARVQTVNKADNPKLHALLLEVDKLTGVPILLNTSFNRPGEPIVESPIDALRSFNEGSLDSLIIGQFFIEKRV